VGASAATMTGGTYLAFGISGAIPHLVGMAGSARVIAVNTDPNARIFDHADAGAVADAAEIARLLCEGHPFG